MIIKVVLAITRSLEQVLLGGCRTLLNWWSVCCRACLLLVKHNATRCLINHADGLWVLISWEWFIPALTMARIIIQVTLIYFLELVRLIASFSIFSTKVLLILMSNGDTANFLMLMHERLKSLLLSIIIISEEPTFMQAVWSIDVARTRACTR